MNSYKPSYSGYKYGKLKMLAHQRVEALKIQKHLSKTAMNSLGDVQVAVL